jgi:tetratricopeptide (TPR) repeat protein/phosphohistidine swiveling domain-containing protein
MKMKLIRSAVFGPIFLMLLFPAICFAQADKIFKENGKAVVVVVTFDEKNEPLMQGSGFVVREDGAIVTNYHVIGNAKDIKVKVGEKVLDVEGLILADKENDLVILKAKGEKLQTVKIGDSEKATIGEKVYVISSPKGMENTISDGLLSGIREISPDKKVLQITAPVSSGSSGSPVFNKDGEVIGIATFLLEEAQNLNFAMPVDLIKDKIKNKKITALKESDIEDYKKTAEYWFYLGLAYGDLGMYKDAIESYKQAIRINPDSGEAHFNLGAIYSKSGMYKEGIEAYKQAIRINPDFAEAHYNLGNAYFKSGMFMDAIVFFIQAIRIKPDYADAHYNLGLTYDKLGMYKEAIEAHKQAIRINPDFEMAHNNLGVAYAKSGMYKEAIEAYKQAIRIKPDYARAHYYLGIAYLELGERGSALEEYKILKELDKEMANKLFNAIYK